MINERPITMILLLIIAAVIVAVVLISNTSIKNNSKDSNEIHSLTDFEKSDELERAKQETHKDTETNILLSIAEKRIDYNIVNKTDLAPEHLIYLALEKILIKFKSEAESYETTLNARNDVAESLFNKVSISVGWAKSHLKTSEFQSLSTSYSVAIEKFISVCLPKFQAEISGITSITEINHAENTINRSNCVLMNFAHAFHPSTNNFEFVTEQLKTIELQLNNKKTNIYDRDNILIINQKSNSLFNLAFYLINSDDITEVPNGNVMTNNFDFKSEYFPTFYALKYQDFGSAKLLFDLSARADSRNLYAKLYGQISALREDMHSQYLCLDREVIINNIKSIEYEFPNNPIVYIELANAYASVGDWDAADEYTEKALAITDCSAYILHCAATIYHNKCDDDKESAIMSDIVSCDFIHPRISFLEALYAFRKQNYLKSYFRIQKAIEQGKSEDYFRLKADILKYFKVHLSEKQSNPLFEESAEDLPFINNFKQRRELLFAEHHTFIAFSKVEFNKYYTSVSIILEDNNTESNYSLLNSANSVLLLDLNISLNDLLVLNISPDITSIIVGEYSYNIKDRVLLIRGVNIEQFFN